MTIKKSNIQLDYSIPKVMGILNATPDSFSDGGKFNAVDDALKQIDKMVEEGASIIDIGGESTRPGSEPVPAQEEENRVLPILEKAVKKYPHLIFSVDTMKFEVAQKALDAGAQWINDVSGLQIDPEKAELCAEYGATLVIMHSKGSPKIMQDNPQYEDIESEVFMFLLHQARVAEAAGCSNIILDPGFGFGKTLDHNITLFNSLPVICSSPYPVLVGISRKSMISTMLNGRDIDDRLTGTIILNFQALVHGVKIIRVHDVKKAVDSIRIFQQIKTGIM